MQYFLAYLALWFSSLPATRSYQISALIVWIILLGVLVGTREDTGCDFSGYLNRFESYKWNLHLVPHLSSLLLTPEPGFAAINYIVIHFGLGYMWVNIISATIFFVCAFLFSVRREHPVGLLALFFPIVIVQLAMSGIRQATAVALLMLAWNAFVEGRRLKATAWILAASTFHVSAIIFLPTILVIGNRVSVVRLAVATVILLPLGGLLAGERIEVYSTRYVEGDVESFGAVFRVGLILLTAVAFRYYSPRYERLYPSDFNLMHMFSIFSFGVAALYFLSPIAAHRIGFYVAPIQLLILQRLPSVVAWGRKEPLLHHFPYAVYGLYVAVWFGVSRHAQACYVPYESYLL